MATRVEPVVPVPGSPDASPRSAQAAVERLRWIWDTPRSLVGSLTTVDHKTIGIRYLWTAAFFFVLAGADAALMRLQLARPGAHVLSPEAYDQLFSMHGTAMIFLYASPVLSGFSNFLVPLLIGSRDMAFPRLNAFSYWSFLFAGCFLYGSILLSQAPDAGWFAYVPLSTRAYTPGPGLDFYALGLLFLTISTTVGAANFIVSIAKLRAPGMSVNRMPIYVWSTLSASVAMVFALPSLTVALLFLELDRRYGTHFYDPQSGGSALLWQHLFWVFGHPWVYVIVLPAFGIISTIIPTFCRRPLAAYTLVALASVSVALFGFGVWAHHMFTTGMSAMATSFFSAASMTVSLPSGITTASWIATIWYGKPVFRTPFLYCLGFIGLFVIGGLSGVMTGLVAFDRQATDTYFIVAHLHYVLVGANVFPVLAGIHYWFPKFSGKLLNDTVGKLEFWLLFVGANVLFFPMHQMGIQGMPRRVYTYAPGMGLDTPNLVSTIGAGIMGVGFLVFLGNLAYSLWKGPAAGDNPWGASTLEWSVSSPPPAYNFARIPTVRGREPLWEQDADEITKLDSGARGAVLLDGRETLGTSVMDGADEGVMHMPGDSPWPLVLASALMLLFVGVMLGAFWPVALGAAATVVALGAWFWPSGHRGPGIARPGGTAYRGGEA